ncbi:MAG: sugar ABC transporter ATP-binding protein [Clostridia bacterium]|nr:sugar ABC transporter ATP-binding protein [Clostridia bacterium]
MGKTILKMEGITKYIFDEFGKPIRNSNVRILSNVNFDLREGEVHVIVGENGAGKSTLMKVLGGIIPPDEGSVTLNDAPYTAKGPKEAREQGIAFIHQELNLCTNMDIAHNIFLGREPTKNGFVDHKTIYAKSREFLDTFGFHDIDPKTMIRDLSTGRQQVVEIVKALSYDAKIIIMDEPTSSLSTKEIEHLFTLIRKMRKDGISIIYISHRFDELTEIGDRITVLRDGQSIATMDMSEFDYDNIVHLMVGRSVGKVFECKHEILDEEILRTEGVKISPRTEPVDIVVRRGEIVGLGGLVGSGRSELAKTIFGARPIFGGKIIYKGKEYANPTPVKSIENGLCYLTEDRKIEGLITAKTIRENISMASLKRLFPKHVVNKKLEKETAAGGIKDLNVICRTMEQLVSTLSGGNQQKVLFSKWLTAKPDLLILDEPTRGIDVNAKAEIYQIIDNIAKQGVAILMISSELPELIGMSDRIYVMRQGAVSLEIKEKAEMTQEIILQNTLG